jgi:hypothetical protein
MFRVNVFVGRVRKIFIETSENLKLYIELHSRKLKRQEKKCVSETSGSHGDE